MTDDQLKRLIYQFVAWYRCGQTLYPQDTINMLIDLGAVQKSNVESHWGEAMKNIDIQPRLPNNHITIS